MSLIKFTKRTAIKIQYASCFANTIKLGNCMEAEGVVPLNNKTFDPNMTNHTIDVYGNLASAPSRAVLLLLKALNIKYKLININLFDQDHLKPDFIKINPLHTIPTIIDNGFVVYDSHAIMAYLVNYYAKDDSLYPKEPRKAAVVNQRLFFNVGTLWSRVADYMAPVLFMNQPPDQVKAERIQEALNFLDIFVKDQQWMGGSDLTIADFAIVPIVSTLEAIGFDISKYTNLYSWYDRVKQNLSGYGYDEINQKGTDIIANVFKNQLKNSQIN